MSHRPKEKTVNSPLGNPKLLHIQSIEPGETPLLANQNAAPCCPAQPEKNAAPQATDCCPTSLQDSCCPASPQGSATTVNANTEPGQPCCGPRVMPKLNYIPVGNGTVRGFPRVDASLKTADHIGAFRARMGPYRMNYAIEPGLVALGEPGPESDVLVTANYKLSFDHLRRHLPARNVWILVLDTWGINVWCAAGKGTFGTEELVRRIAQTQLAQVVTTRKLILPQLGAPGVAAHEVKKQTGFSCIWGPVEARDLGAFIDNGRKKTPAMRQKQFPMTERAVLLPIELRPALKVIFTGVLIASPLAALTMPGNYLYGVVHYLVLLSIFMLSALFSGAVLTPLLLPFLPGRAFAVKSILPSVALSALLYMDLYEQIAPPELIALGLLLVGVASYAAMNFTGASTYTSISGVKKEMRYAVPAQIAAAASGIILWITSHIIM